MSKRKIGMWMYTNSGGDKIAKKMIEQLAERDIKTINNIRLHDCVSENGHILYNDLKVDKLDLFFSYNAGEQTQYQTYLYQALDRLIPMINSYHSFALSEDKFHTSLVLRNKGVKTADYKLCHRDNSEALKKIIKKWDKMVYKPTDEIGRASCRERV